MARFVVPIVVLLSLVGGYVVGQQPQSDEPTLQLGEVSPVPAAGRLSGLPVNALAEQVGRFVPAGPDRMLDSTQGTLYAVTGDTWHVVATLATRSGATSEAAVAPVPPSEELKARIRARVRERLMDAKSRSRPVSE